MKIIFAGTTDFGIPTLEKIKDQVVLIITQPDKLSGRDKRLTPPPVKIWAEKHGILVQQPEKIIDLKPIIANLEADLLLVAAFGQIVPKEILELPKFQSINIHASILPKYRGASPIQAAIMNGDSETGITLIQMDEKMDHGPIVAIAKIKIDERDTYQVLHRKLSSTAKELVAETLVKWFDGSIVPLTQNHAEATYVKLISRSDAKINWSRPAVEIDRMIRALNPEPGTWTTLKGKNIIISETEPIHDHKIELPGKLYLHNGEIAVKCLDHSLLIKKIKPEGKSEMSGKDFLNGLQNLSDKLFF